MMLYKLSVFYSGNIFIATYENSSWKPFRMVAKLYFTKRAYVIGHQELAKISGQQNDLRIWI
jgi:hypothetical protein